MDLQVGRQKSQQLVGCSMGRSPCCAKEGLNRGAWTALEDKMLTDYVRANGEGSWRNLPNKAGLKRCGKSCRLRWLNYLRPDIKRGNISPDEEDLIIRLHNLLGNKWSLIAGRLPGRSDNEIKNYWNTNLCKKVAARNNPQPLQLTKKKPGNSASPQLGKTTKVIRTKAVRCTSQVFAKSQPHDFRQVSERSGPSGDSCLVAEVNFDIGGPDTTSDFLLDDFDLAELCLSNSDFSDVGLQGLLEDIDNDLSSSVDDIAFSDTMLPEWASPAGDSDPDNALPNLFSISSFLDPEEEFVPNTN